MYSRVAVSGLRTFCSRPPKDLPSRLDSAANLNLEDSLNPDQTSFSTSAYSGSGDKWRKARTESKAYVLDGKDHSHGSVLLFPGQGSQFVGMGKVVVQDKLASAQALYDRASQILDYDLQKLCLEGPKSSLDSTVYCQPALVVTSLAAVERLYQERPEAVENCIAAAGFSVGEITALIFSGAISFEDGIRLVKVRAEAMQFCSDAPDESGVANPHGMMTVFYGKDAKVGLSCEVAAEWCRRNHPEIPQPRCGIANVLYTGAKVLAGHKKALDFVAENKADFGIRKVQYLPVSGAFHTKLMSDAKQLLAEALTKTVVNTPRIPVFSNVDATPYKNASMVRSILPRQIVKEVKWEQTMHKMFRYDDESLLPSVYECGPGGSLCAMLKKINGKVAKRASHVKV